MFREIEGILLKAELEEEKQSRDRQTLTEQEIKRMMHCTLSAVMGWTSLTKPICKLK